MATRGAREEGPPVGVWAAGKKKGPDPARIAERASQFEDGYTPPEGVQPLNAGFFLLQRMRKNRPGRVRGKLRGGR